MEGRPADASVDDCTDGPTAWSLRAPRAIAPFDRNPGAIAVDDTAVYWTESLTCADASCIPAPVVMTAPLTGGVPSGLIESDEGQPGALAVTRDHLFVDIGEQVWRMGKNGAAPEAVDAATTFVADDDAIYFWEGSQIIRLAADTLERTTVGESSAFGKNFQLAGDQAYWLRPDPVEIWRVPLAGGEPAVAANIEETAGDSLAVASGERAFLVTWPSSAPQAQLSLTGIALAARTPTPVADVWDSINEVVADETNVYWMEPNAHRLSRAPLAGGCVESREHDGQISLAMVPAEDGIIVAIAGSIAIIER